MTRTDQDLLLAANRHDRAAIGELYRRHHDRLRALAARTLIDVGLAEDAVNDVFAALLTHDSGYDPAKGSPVGFLQTLVHRRSIDIVRSREAARRRDHTTTQRPEPAADPLDRLDVVLSRRKLRHALDALTTNQRHAVVHRYLCELPGIGIAADLSIPNSTFKTRVRDGLSALRTALG